MHIPDESATSGLGTLPPGSFRRRRAINLAAEGPSTKTVRSDGLWAKSLAGKPTFILIQFGHNDSHAPDRPESTAARTDSPANLRRYVEEARRIDATPILLTPVVRRVFDAEGRLVGELRPYAEAMKRVALANDPEDRTHSHERGARAIAALVMRELPRLAPALARHSIPR